MVDHKEKKQKRDHYLLKATSLSYILNILIRNNFKIYRNIDMLVACCIGLLAKTPVFALTRLIEKKVIFRTKIKKTTIQKDPIFILGHWRSGTTYLHNIICLDEQFGFINAFQAFVPKNCILLARKKEAIQKEMPETRPMDNIRLNLDDPFEEEFALLYLWPYSFYLAWMFPEKMEEYFEKYLNNPSEKYQKKWGKIYFDLIKKISFINKGKQLILKSPTNTMRIPQLLKMFPNAKFVNIKREATTTILSMFRVHKKFVDTQAFQNVSDEQLLHHTVTFFHQVEKKYEHDKSLIPEKNLIELTYEDFVSNPVGNLKNIYNKFIIDGFEGMEKKFIEYSNGKKDYKPLTTDNKEMIKKIKEIISVA